MHFYIHIRRSIVEHIINEEQKNKLKQPFYGARPVLACSRLNFTKKKILK